MTREEFEQLLNIEVDYIPIGRHNRPGTKISADYITVHNTDNSDLGADAHAHAKFLNTTGYYTHNGKTIWVSWHYSVDDKRIVNHLPLNELGYHAVSGNSKSLALEICMNKGIDQTAANLRAARLIAALLYDRKPKASQIVPHYHWTGKDCPSLLLNNGKPGAKWQDFLNLVQQEFSRID